MKKIIEQNQESSHSEEEGEDYETGLRAVLQEELERQSRKKKTLLFNQKIPTGISHPKKQLAQEDRSKKQLVKEQNPDLAKPSRSS